MTPSNNATSSSTPSNTPSASNTGSQTASPSASLSSGASVSPVSTGTWSPSGTASNMRTPVATPAPTSSPVIQPAWLNYLYGTTYEVPITDLGLMESTAGQYGYVFRPFQWVYQYTNPGANYSTGTYAGWNAWTANASCPSGYQLSSQSYNRGTYGSGCSTTLLGQQRSTQLNFLCSGNGTTFTGLSLGESPACLYTLPIYVDCSRNPYLPNSLCVAPSATATSTQTQTSSSTATSTQSSTGTPSATLSLGASPSVTVTQTASPSTTGSSTSTPSSTATMTPSSTRSATSSQTPTRTATATVSSYIFPTWAAYLFGNSYAGAFSGYIWTVYPFNDATQGSTSIGTFSSWIIGNDPTCPSGQRYLSQYFTNGAKCSSGFARTANVTFTCGGSMVVTAATEPVGCQYQLTLDVNCTANPAVAGTMCVYPSSTSTPSVTPSSTGSSSRTPSSTVSTSLSATLTPSASLTPTSSLSTGATVSSSMTITPRCARGSH
jgi:hypothetical protein